MSDCENREKKIITAGEELRRQMINMAHSLWALEPDSNKRADIVREAHQAWDGWVLATKDDT